MIEAVRLFSLLVSACVILSDGAPRFANYLQDYMVLQRAPQRAVVWGFGDTQKLTTLRVNDRIYTTISRAEVANVLGESIWSVTLDPVSDEGPFDIHVSQSLPNGTLVTITLRDVLFGDVWLCSGQSNMQMAVSDIFNATEEINNAGHYPKIRVFTAALKSSDKPIEELLGIIENWSVASPQSIGGPSFTYMSAVCWLYGRMIHVGLNGRPIGLIATSYSGTAIELWMPPAALHNCGIFSNEVVPVQPYGPSPEIVSLNSSNLFNAMIYPFTRMVVYGAIWYQGESNADYNLQKYNCTFKEMIEYWRQTWNERTNGMTDVQFPFGFVQLSTWSNSSTTVGGFPWVRWHQTFDVGYVPNYVIPKVFMAVTLDLRDDPHSLHPRTKYDVGYRLSRAGLAVAYNEDVEFTGPIIHSITLASDVKTVNITYQNVQKIEVRSSDGFEVCCDAKLCQNDTVWEPANIISYDDLTIVVNGSCVGMELAGLRYLWHETPCLFKRAAIYSASDPNLPSPPFIRILETLG